MNRAELGLEKMKSRINGLTTGQIIDAFEATEINNDDYIYVVRGVLMDVLEQRNLNKFEAWMDSSDSSPRAYFR